MKVNLNTTARVTLTEAGLRRLRDYYHEIRLGLRPPESQDTTDRPVVFLLRDLMRIFGRMLYSGAIVDNQIEIDPAPDYREGP